jgi:hypothetical protein
MSEDEFSVWIFFPDETYMAEARWVDAEFACRLAHELIKALNS